MIINNDDGKSPAQPERVLTPLPFDGKFRLTQAFGENPAVYHRLGLPGHNGLDWGMPEGQEIRAVDEGFIIRVEERLDGFGKHVKIQHQWGQSLYAHLSDFRATLNQPVKQGDVIGLSGNTGFSTGPHLHFGVRIKPYNLEDGWYGYTNPQRYLQWPEADIVAAAAPLLATDDNRAALAFQMQEARMQGDLWEEEVVALLQRYLPGQLPPDADPMAALENLLASWSDELEALRSKTLAGFFES